MLRPSHDAASPAAPEGGASKVWWLLGRRCEPRPHSSHVLREHIREMLGAGLSWPSPGRVALRCMAPRMPYVVLGDAYGAGYWTCLLADARNLRAGAPTPPCFELTLSAPSHLRQIEPNPRAVAHVKRATCESRWPSWMPGRAPGGWLTCPSPTSCRKGCRRCRRRCPAASGDRWPD